MRRRMVYADSEREVFAVEKVEFWQRKTSTACQLAGRVEPLAVIISTADQEYALDLEGEPAETDLREGER